MGTVSIRDLARETSKVVDEVAKSGRPMLVTRRGKPIAAVVPVDPDALEDFVLENSPSFVRAVKAAKRELSTGRTRSATEVFEELEGESAPTQ